MSTVLSSPGTLDSQDAGTHARIAKGLLRLAREPLLHFVILGGVLFGLDAAISARADNPNTIVVGSTVDEEARQVFETSRGRAPNAEELQALRQVWLDNEVLYREGLALSLDKGDPAIRERVIFKALSIVDAGTKRPPYDDAVLHEWFENNRSRYDDPARYSFEEAAIVGDSSEATVRAFVSALNAGTSPDSQAGLRVFKDRPHDNLVKSYGESFAAELEALPKGQWSALQSRSGWRAMRLESTTPAVPADFEKLRGIVMQDWTDAVMSGQRSAAVHAMAKKYTVKIEGAAE